jgi:hypothetical protein
MNIQKNPFVDLYVTESISADTFVKVFSTALLDEADTLALYQPGNVILIGLQGSGKTALLNLLKPEVLLAYRRANVAWPLPARCSRFISAGINLSKSGAMDFGQRTIELNNANEERRYALYFADFLNYWIVDDLLQSLQTLIDAEDVEVKEFLGLKISNSRLDELAQTLAKNRCWLGALPKISTLEELRGSIQDRIIEYRNFLNYNSDELPEYIKRSKTSVGEPISATVDVLRRCGIIPEDLPVLIRIDQFEDLMGLEEAADQELRVEYRAVIYKMLGTRDSRLSYRVGARPYAVRQDFRMLGTSSVIEELRNYTIVDIDNILRRKEHSRGVFPKFAEDVFTKRLKEAGYSVPSRVPSLISHVFGKKPSIEERARSYVKDSVENVIDADSDWPPLAEGFLNELAITDPISAKLGEAWLRQQLRRDLEKVPDVTKREWDQSSRKWWKKERVEQALLQIAAARKQRMVWAGAGDVLSLSGGNVLVFLSICQLVWAEYLRSGGVVTDAAPQIHSRVLQDLGIQQASEYWYRKLRADPNGGDDRHRFVSVIAGEFRSALREDKRMSYPGANGFSLSERDLDNDAEVSVFLDLCTAYGVLTVSRHTPKMSARGISKKWYLFPILSPYFQLPVAHTKEPIYSNVTQVRGWLQKSNVLLRAVKNAASFAKATADISSPHQMSLPFDGQKKK